MQQRVQRKVALSLWVDRKVVTYLKEKHSRFEATLEEQSQLAEQYPVILPFLDGEGAMELTAEEHQAIKEYLNLREKAEFLIREYHSYLGQAADLSGLRSRTATETPGRKPKKTGRAVSWSSWRKTRWKKRIRCSAPPIRSTGGRWRSSQRNGKRFMI